MKKTQSNEEIIIKIGFVLAAITLCLLIISFFVVTKTSESRNIMYDNHCKKLGYDGFFGYGNKYETIKPLIVCYDNIENNNIGSEIIKHNIILTEDEQCIS